MVRGPRTDQLWLLTTSLLTLRRSLDNHQHAREALVQHRRLYLTWPPRGVVVHGYGQPHSIPLAEEGSQCHYARNSIITVAQSPLSIMVSWPRV